MLTKKVIHPLVVAETRVTVGRLARLYEEMDSFKNMMAGIAQWRSVTTAGGVR